MAYSPPPDPAECQDYNDNTGYSANPCDRQGGARGLFRYGIDTHGRSRRRKSGGPMSNLTPGTHTRTKLSIGRTAKVLLQGQAFVIGLCTNSIGRLSWQVTMY